MRTRVRLTRVPLQRRRRARVRPVPRVGHLYTFARKAFARSHFERCCHRVPFRPHGGVLWDRSSGCADDRSTRKCGSAEEFRDLSGHVREKNLAAAESARGQRPVAGLVRRKVRCLGAQSLAIPAGKHYALLGSRLFAIFTSS